ALVFRERSGRGRPRSAVRGRVRKSRRSQLSDHTSIPKPHEAQHAPAPAFLAPVQAVLEQVRRRAAAIDQTGEWPEADLRLLADAGGMRWAVPREFGGDGLSALDLHLGYEAIAAASLAVALVLSQRDSAVALVDAAEHSP